MADTKKTTTGSAARPTPTDRLVEAKNENAALAAEVAALKATAAANAARPALQPAANSGSKAWLLVVALLLVIASFATVTGAAYLLGMFPDRFYPERVVSVEKVPDNQLSSSICPSGTAGTFPDCVAAGSAPKAEKMDAQVPPEGVSTPMSVVNVFIESPQQKCCGQQETCCRGSEPPPKPRYKPKPPVVYIPPPVVETSCYLRVATWSDSGRDQPYYKPVNVYLAVDGGGKITSGQLVQGLGEIPIPCSALYSRTNLEVCFGNGRESELLKPRDNGAANDLRRMRLRYERAKAAGKSRIVLNVSEVGWHPG